MELQFANPWVLYLLWLVPAMALWWYTANRQRERTLATFISATMQAKLRPVSSNVKFTWQIGLVAAGLLLILVAAARPQWGMKEETVYQRSRDLVIALDVSRSMLANDVHPNRLQRAKADIMDLIRELPGDRVALVAFRRTAILLCPLTTDYAYLRQALDAVTTESAPRGETNIGEAIKKALQAFESDPGAHRAIILISDGEDLSGTAVKAAEKAGEKKVPIFTVGLGNRRGSTIPEEGNRAETVKYKGENVVTKLNDDVLYTIANKTGGAYLPVETASMANTTLGTLYRDYLRQISGRDMEETLQRRHVERYQFLLLPAVLLLLAAACLSQGRLKAGKQRSEVEGLPPSLRGYGEPRRSEVRTATARRTTAVLVLLLVAVAGAGAQTNEPHTAPSTNAPATQVMEIPPGREGARLGQKLYLLGKYEESAQAYLAAARSAGEKSQRDFRFNAATALFKAGKFKEAAETLKDLALSDKGSREDVFMGLGSSLFRAADKPVSETDADKAAARERALREAGEAFKEAARIRGDNDTARRNLAVVLDVLPQAEEQALMSKLMVQYAQTPAGTIINEMLANQRKLVEDIPAAFSNASPAQIKTLEDLSVRQKNNADLWIPLKSKLLNEMARQPDNTNMQQQVAFLNQMVETTRDQMLGGDAALRDLDPAGYPIGTVIRKGHLPVLAIRRPYPLILQEDLLRQTNVITVTPSISPNNVAQRLPVKANQDEAMALTTLFVERFTQAVPEGGTESNEVASAEAGQPKGISAEDRHKILELADQAATAQGKAAQLIDKGDATEALTQEKEAYRLLKDIEKLLPKDKNQNSSESQDKQQQDQQKQEKKDEQKQDQSQQQQPNPQESQDQQKQDEKKQEPKETDQKDSPPEDVKKLIERAMQREKEHEADKRRMNNQFIPPSAIEKDW